MRFIEFVIATTIGSIVGAYIARDIDFSFNLVARAVFAVAILAVFFFLVYKISHSWTKRKTERNKPQEQREQEAFNEEYPVEENHMENRKNPEEEEKFPDYPEDTQSKKEIPR